MDPLIAGLALLVIFAAALGLRECPCDDRNCVRAHTSHRASEREARDLAHHRTWHRGTKSAYCRHCHDE